MLVEIIKFFVCSDNVAVWVSILPQFLNVHFPIFISIKDDEALFLRAIKLDPRRTLIILVRHYLMQRRLHEFPDSHHAFLIKLGRPSLIIFQLKV